MTDNLNNLTFEKTIQKRIFHIYRHQDTIDDSGATPTFTIELHYAGNSLAVFENTSVTLSEIGAVIEEELTTRQDVLDILALVSDANIELYPILGDTLAMAIEQSGSIEPTNPMPTEDQVTNVTEPTIYDRYTVSVWIDYVMYGGVEEYTYVTEDSAGAVKSYFESYSNDSTDWTLMDQQSDDTSYTLYASNNVAGKTAMVVINHENNYDSGSEYVITLGNQS